MELIEKREKLALSVAEVVSVTPFSFSFVRAEIKKGKLKAKKFGDRVVILSEDLDKYLKGSEEK